MAMCSPENKLPSADIITDASTLYEFPENSIAVVGAAGRFPRANNLEELWNLMSTDKSRVEEVPLRKIDIPARSHSRLAQDANATGEQRCFGNFLDESIASTIPSLTSATKKPARWTLSSAYSSRR